VSTMPNLFESEKIRLILTVVSVLSLIFLVTLFYLPYLPYAIIPYLWIGWFLPIEGIILLLALSCMVISVSGYYLFSKKERTKTLLNTLAEYWWIGMRLYLGVSWIMITFFIWTPTFIRYEFPRMVNYMASQGPYPWYSAFLTNSILPNTQLFANLIQYAQLLIGFCLILGLLTNFASALGIFLNINFLIAIGWADRTGTVAAQNLFLAFHQILFVLLHIGRLLGIDKYLAKEFPRVFLW